VRSIGLVIFDWAGTTVDFGSFAPVAAFVEVFAGHGVTVTPAEARGPMGLHKRDHIQTLLETPAISRRWQEVHGRTPNQADTEALYQAFIPRQLEVLDRHSQLIPGLLECVTQLRERGIKIGATTGYFREAAERVYAAARAQGFIPDHSACADEVRVGRPAPWMIFRNMEALGVFPPQRVLKVGDTLPDIEEGHNAGTWSAAVLDSSNEIGIAQAQWKTLPDEIRERLLRSAALKFENAGADAVIASLAGLPELIDQLNARIEHEAD
jgi:phosphonoacetaldehyde hydrolase